MTAGSAGALACAAPSLGSLENRLAHERVVRQAVQLQLLRAGRQQHPLNLPATNRQDLLGLLAGSNANPEAAQWQAANLLCTD